MNDNDTRIETFFDAWSKLHYDDIIACYALPFVYNNPLVGVLPYEVAVEYWKLRCEKTKELTLTQGPIRWTDEEYAVIPWHTRFIYYGNGKTIEMNGTTFLRIQNNLITEHSDAFKISQWVKQVYGWQGILFSFTGMLKRKAIVAEQNILDEYIGVQ